MSGYYEKSGIFELTSKKSGVFFKRESPPEGFKSKEAFGSMYFLSDLLRFFGLEVVKVASNYLRVKATPGQVWEALSGRPSDPEKEKWYHVESGLIGKPETHREVDLIVGETYIIKHINRNPRYHNHDGRKVLLLGFEEKYDGHAMAKVKYLDTNRPGRLDMGDLVPLQKAA